MLTYAERAHLCHNPTAQKLFTLMAAKETNLSASIDVTRKKDVIDLANELGPSICVLKTHIDIIEDFDMSLIDELNRLASRHQFIIFEDRKFADIGNTVKMQYEKGIYKIASWAPITNAHPIVGPSIIEGLKEVGLPLGNGLLLLAELSAKGSMAKGSYTQAAIEMAQQHTDFVIGFITQKRLTNNDAFINATPGVNLSQTSDKLGQQYVTPKHAIVENGSDIIIVGRGLYRTDNPDKMAQRYREEAWDAYKQRLKK
jgi:orotidine 5'-phosphate decarboxylase subfamily 1